MLENQGKKLKKRSGQFRGSLWVGFGSQCNSTVSHLRNPSRRQNESLKLDILILNIDCFDFVPENEQVKQCKSLDES